MAKHTTPLEKETSDLQYKVSLFLNEDTLLLQLAEEASELSQAAIKLVRDKSNNSTDKTRGELIYGLTEEISDVVNVLEVLSYYDWEVDRTIINSKMKRWVHRLGLDTEVKEDDEQGENKWNT